jgi:SAM-dependent methyltransferase
MPPPAEPPRLTVLTLAEGLHLAHAAEALHRLGLFDEMGEPVAAETLARRHRLDAEMLRGLLDYLSLRTDLVARSAAGYATTAAYDAEARFLLALHAGAYAPAAAGLARSLRRPGSATSGIDRAAQARAFAGVPASSAGALPGILHQLGARALLDLGCGTGAVLCTLAAADPAFRGWGIDASPPMCRAARRNAREAGLSRRVKVFEGDGRHPERLLSPAVRASVDSILAGDFANEMVGRDGRPAIAWLRRLRRLFPGRMLVVADYYGRLGGEGAADPRTLLHDFAQLISGQGVPPADSAGWEAIYDRAGCRLAHVIEDPGTTRFLHILKL